MASAKEPIRIRQKKLANGNKSLYLDIYRDGKLHATKLVEEKTTVEPVADIKYIGSKPSQGATRVVDLQNGEYGFKSEYATDTLFFDYYRAMCEKRHGNPESRGNWGNWYSCLHHLMKYEKNERITFAEITTEWVQGFHDYLEKDAVAWGHDYRKRIKDKPLSRNSKLSYFNKLRACLNQAFEDGVIPNNPARKVENFKEEEGTRMYLTIDEVRKLAQTDCEYPCIKRAFLFSCLTGLRRSDIERLTWGEVFNQGDFTRIIFKQKKTKGQEYLDITEQAADLMGERGEPDVKVFPDIHSPTVTNTAIREWVLRAGIQKKITFHCGRHTFATMMLDLGTDIYTVSKLLGHRQLSTTQIYAKVMDKNKQRAVANIPNVLGKRTDDNE